MTTIVLMLLGTWLSKLDKNKKAHSGQKVEPAMTFEKTDAEIQASINNVQAIVQNLKQRINEIDNLQKRADNLDEQLGL